MLSTTTADLMREADGRLVVVSNRAPIEHHTDDRGRVARRAADGGLVSALGSMTCDRPITWIAAAATDEDRRLATSSVCLGGTKRLRYVTPPSAAYELSYNSFCNPVLWFLQHSLWGDLPAERAAEHAVLHGWQNGYLPVNRAFAETIARELRSDGHRSSVMLHDYHLYLVPRFIRDLGSPATLQHFVHIPWPSPQTWRRLPRSIVAGICDGLLANDSVVFQTTGSARNFIDTCRDALSDALIQPDGAVAYRGHRTRVSANPISVDPGTLLAQVRSPEARSHIDRLRAVAGERTIVRVDRLDPAKNVAAGFRAFDLLLDRHPEWRGRVRFLAFLVPSRTNVAEYRAYADEVFALVDEINTRHGDAGWRPISVFFEQNRLQALAAMTLYDVLLVNSLADGMNLVAKEGPIVNQRDGVLVLSTRAGAYEELHGGALPVSPHDIEGTAQALHRALEMPPPERRERAALLVGAVMRRTLSVWLHAQLRDMDAAHKNRHPAPTRSRAATASARA
jgi:trehalose 6-phosphate synthase